jgi:hypothetical protein
MGSGKTRVGNITKATAHNGKLTTGMSDSALFRSANNCTLIFDEAEDIARKEKQAQRILLNSGYKKGAVHSITKEKYVNKVKEFVVEDYPIYCPKMILNINGMEDVLADRCISFIIEKSNNPAKTKLMEDFDTNPFFIELKRTLEQVSVGCVGVGYENNVLELWNSYINTIYTYTPLYTTTLLYTTIHNTTLTIEDIEFFNKIDNVGIDARNLELYFPLFIIAKYIGCEIFEDILRIAKDKTKIKKEQQLMNDKDASVIDFVAHIGDEATITFTPIKELFMAFKNFYQREDSSLEWLNSSWFGVALYRLNLITQKRRLSLGVEVVLNKGKALDKLKMFKEVEQ